MIEIKHILGDSPICPKCGNWNALLDGYSYSKLTGFKPYRYLYCRDCGAQFDEGTYTLVEYEQYQDKSGDWFLRPKQKSPDPEPEPESLVDPDDVMPLDLESRTLVRYYVGLIDKDGKFVDSSVYRKTVDYFLKSRYEKTLGETQSYTAFEANGYWKGIPEPSYVIERLVYDPEEAEILAAMLKSAGNQDSVLVTQSMVQAAIA